MMAAISTADVTCTCGSTFSPMRMTFNKEGKYAWCAECKTNLRIGDSYEYENKKKKEGTDF